MTTIATETPQTRQRKRAKAWQAFFQALPLVLPFTLVYVLFLIYPSLRAVQLSLTNSDLGGIGKYIGLENYRKLFADPLFGTSLVNTLYFILLTVVPNTLLAFAFALMVNRLKRAKKFVLAAFFLPYVLPVSVVTNLWIWLLDQSFGLINIVTGLSISWFQDPTYSMPAVAFVTIWWTVGFNILLFLAALQSIPREYFEAAALDGANDLQVFRFITWPSMWSTTSLVLLLQLIAQFKIFDQVYLLTGGGPYDKTLVTLLYLYRKGFQEQQGGYASAIGILLLIIIFAASLLQERFLGRGRSE